jgi:lysozyme family protein
VNIDATQVIIIFLLVLAVRDIRDGILAWHLIGRPFNVQPQPSLGTPPAPQSVPPAITIPLPTPKPVSVPAKPSSNFSRCIPLVLKWEGGNDDDPRDPGGRTSRGILQREWDVWRKTHPGLPSDVWQAPQDQIIEIYKQEYWDALSCDSLHPGVDYAVFDYGVNSGISRSAKVLEGLVGTSVDGVIGPLTLAAAVKVDPTHLINQICDERLAFLQRLSTWGTYGHGWAIRVEGVRKGALAMVSS